MTVEQYLLAAVAGLASAVVTLFGLLRVQYTRSIEREDKLREQYVADRVGLESELARSRQEFTRILYRLANIEDADSTQE